MRRIPAHRRRFPQLRPAGLGLLLAAAAVPGTAAPGSFSAVEPAQVEAGSFYHGASLHVSGTVGERSQVAIRVTGASEHHTFNRRGKIGGVIWGGVEHVTFRHAPSLYAVYSSAALAAVAAPELRDRLRLGYRSVAARMEVEGTREDREEMISHFVRLKESEGLYRVAPGSVRLGDVERGRRAFEVSMPLPSTAPPGELEVAVLELADGTLLGEDVARVRLDRVGMPAWLFRLAHRQSGLFGLLAVSLLLATGVAVDLLGSWRRARRPHPAVVVLAGLARGLDDAVLASRRRPRSAKDVERMHARYRLFRALLAVNNELLELLGELEEESSWTSFRHVRVRMGIRALFDGTADMVRLLNELTGDRYFDLANVVTSLRADVNQLLARSPAREEWDATAGPAPEAPRLALAMKAIDSRNAALVGGKALALARIDCDLGYRVPEFFAVTVEAYREFIEAGGLASSLRTILAPARLDAPDDFRRRCEMAQDLVGGTPVPPAVADAIERAHRASGFPAAEGLAIRSSATGEGSELSFAGQFETYLNVLPASLVEAWKEVVSSRFSARAVFYRRAAGLAEVDTPMAVLVQRMVRARASGVAFTRRPDDPRSPALLISAARGLGPEVSAGTASADQFAVSRGAPHRILERRVARKPGRLVEAPGGGLARVDLPSEEQLRPAIDDGEVARLAATALAIERYFGSPQDVEWALDAEGRILVLQARPLRAEPAEAEPGEPAQAAPLLVRGGDPVWPGRSVGPVHAARTPRELEETPTGSLLVVPQLLPDCVRLLSRVCGIVVERGTVTGHAASILREFRMPSLFGVTGALSALVPGQLASLDVASRSVFAGVLWPELVGRLPVAVHGRRTSGLPGLLAGKLTKLSGSAFLGTWACQSLHDVIRFAHEMAIQSMFDIGDRLLDSPVGGVRTLDSPPPLSVHLVDLGGGIRDAASSRERVAAAEVASVPFQALWRGLADPRFEPGLGERPPPLGAARAASMVTAGVGSPNYACITEAYLNLSSRQAYHYAVVDSFLSDNPNNNHVSLRLKGGGAAPWQRALRAEVVAEILRHRHFSVSTSGDVLSGWLRGVDPEGGAAALATLGYLLRFLPRLDLAMSGPSDVKRYVDAFARAEAAARGGGPVASPA
ncbi:MAG TPA: TIGR02186 family protein [Anaeromyxobacteraceae bacterium]|nr:TIGR02186 family protein [Anaeromyxobacteraceae bacterium]